MAESYMITRSGKVFYYRKPHALDVSVDDVAFHLSNICRFTGAVPFYCVAQHSVLASHYVEETLTARRAVAQKGVRDAALHALLHDAQEAYVGDVASPLKRLLPEYAKIEDRVERAVWDKFGITGEWSAVVKEADMRMLSTEKRDLMPPCPIWDVKLPEPLPKAIEPWAPEEARERFLSRFWDLMRRGVG